MNKKWIILILSVLLAIVAYNYVFQNHRNIAEEKAQFILTTEEIDSAFSTNPSVTEKRYLNKTIEISGTISEKNTNNITLNNKTFCQFTESIQIQLKINSLIKIKGRFIGYDDLLELIKLDQCVIINEFKLK